VRGVDDRGGQVHVDRGRVDDAPGRHHGAADDQRTRIDSSYIDLAERTSEKLPSMIAIVVGLSFVVLLPAFRSLVVPLKAAMANLLSVAAASRHRLGRPRRRDPDRQLRAGPDVRDPLRTLDGLRGVPAHPDAMAIDATMVRAYWSRR
jgi:hypothetical protein